MLGQNNIIFRLYAIAIIVKIAIGIITILFVNLGWFHMGNEDLLIKNLTQQHFFEIYFNSDSGWYKVIAENGYANIPVIESAEWSKPNLHYAFFPMFPLLISLLMHLTSTSFFFAAFVFSCLILYPMVRYFYLFMLHLKFDQDKAYKAVLLFLLFPFSMHIYFIYTEALFFTLLMAGFYFIASKKWMAFVISGALIVLTRPNGLILIVPFYLFCLEENAGLSIQSVFKSFLRPRYYALLIMPLTFFCWLCFQHHLTGHWFAFAEAQAGWKKKTMFPLMALFRNGFWQEQLASIYTIIIMLMAICCFKKWRASINSFVWITILLPLTAGSVISMTRYLSMLFPFYSEAVQLKFINRYFKWIILLLVITQIIVLKLWIEDDSLMY